MKIYLLYPRFNEEKIEYRPPLGIAYIVASLKKIGCKEIKAVDGSLYHSYEEYVSDLKKFDPDILGISMPTALYSETLEYIKIAKEVKPTIKIIVGGPHPSVFPKETLEIKEVNYIVMGEGEITIQELIKALIEKKQLKEIKGIGYKEKGKIFINERRSFTKNLSEFPWPARDFLNMDKYIHTQPFMPLPYPATYIIGSRGCFGNCIFCQPSLEKLVGKIIRVREVKDLVDEIEYLIKKYKIKSINLGADEPTANKRWVISFCKEILRRKIKIKISAPSRIDTIDEEMMYWMKKAGFIHLAFGVESVSDKILKIMRKNITSKKIYEVFKLCEKMKICARANLMIGTPGETAETVNETIQFIRKAKPDFISANITTPTPGTDLYTEAENKGILNVKEKNEIKDYSAGYLRLEELSSEEVQKLTKKVVKEYIKQSLIKLVNPKYWFKRSYFFKAILLYHLSLIKNPKELLRSMAKHAKYGTIKATKYKKGLHK